MISGMVNASHAEDKAAVVAGGGGMFCSPEGDRYVGGRFVVIGEDAAGEGAIAGVFDAGGS